MKKRTFQFFCLFFALLIFTTNSYAKSKNKIYTNSELIDIAGQQRMLGYQIMVAYAQIGQIQSFGNPVTTKQIAVKTFEKNLSTLGQKEDFSLLIDNINTLWNEFKQITLSAPKKQQMPHLISLNSQMINISNKIISLLVKQNKSNKNSNIINISGKQRMLSQRIALYMLLENWGFEENYKEKMQLDLAHFSININFLKKNKDNTKEINKNLKSMKKDYLGLIKIVARAQEDRDYSFTISRYTSQLLRKAKKNTKLYVDLINSEISAQPSEARLAEIKSSKNST